VNPVYLREVTRTLLAAVVVAVLQPLLVRLIGPFSDHPERALSVLVPLAIVIAVLSWPVFRDRRVVLGGGFLAFFVGFCLLFSIAAGTDLLTGRRTPLVGYEQDVPRSLLGLNWLGDWRYRLLQPTPRTGTDTVVITLDRTDDAVARRRDFAVLIKQAIKHRARGIAFDFYFTEASAGIDQLLCMTVAQAEEARLPVYFGYRHVEKNGLLKGDSPPDTLSCLKDHLASLAGYREADNSVRFVPLYFQHDPNAESLSLKVARHLNSGDPKLPANGLVQFTRPEPDLQPWRGMPTEDQVPFFENRFVLVGSARGGDVHQTPFGALPGVKIHELAARSLSQGRFIERLGRGWMFPLIFSFCFLLSVAQARGIGPGRLCAIALALIAATFFAAAAAIRWALVWVDVSYAVLAVASMTGLLVAGSAVQAQRRSRDATVRAAAGPGPAAAAPARRISDVFLSHNGKDKALVRELAEALQARGLEVWLDEWELVPGRPWQEAIEDAIQTAKTAAVVVGPDGLGPWEIPEVRVCLEQGVRRSMPVIPVLLPGVTESPTLPPFLERFTWVDLREGLAEAGIDRLEWGITGVKPRRSRGLLRTGG
jgi:CHASE2 domain-containing sensor protein